MRFEFCFKAATLFCGIALCGAANHAGAQTTDSDAAVASAWVASAWVASAGVASAWVLPDAPEPQSDAAAPEQPPAGQQDSPAAETPAKHKPPPEPKRILGLMPNYRAVSAGELPPPPTPRQAFKIATQNSFDYSSFIFVGLTSLLAEGSNDHPQLGKGVGGFWGYYWRGFLDKSDGNYWVIWALPSVVHEDERYYAKGEGPILKRGIYAASRVLITPNYESKSTFNASEVFGRGIAQSISLTYYPSKDQALGPFMQKYGYAVGRDVLTDVFREFWPDINEHVIHRHHQS